ncbi:MAG: DegT/DnrJ/EryC1/StrS family aminotransferase [Saccharofermentans sp.]|nr:DegT/DnrJ/EryC1/StrS family aminotransferase [Saccharofermentans sp.]
MNYSNDRLGAALKMYLGTDPLPMHMPGHKRNTDVISKAFSEDITEISGFDNLHAPTGLLRDMEIALAELWDYDKAYISVGGATAMLLTAIAAVSAANPGGHALVAMNCHLAVWHAFELTKTPVVPLMPVQDPALPFAGNISAYEVERILMRNPQIKMVVITSPTYEGVQSDCKAIAEVARRYDAVLITDCAHGAHLGLGDSFWGDDQTGDIVIKSLHKTLNAPTQTAVMLTSEDLNIKEDLIRHYIDIFETSSPSYVLLKGVSRMIADINSQKDLFEPWKRGVAYAETELNSLKHFRFWRAPICERSKLVILGDGIRLAEQLRADFNIEVEAAFTTHIIAMTGVGDNEESLARFVTAMKKTDELGDYDLPEIKVTPRPRPHLIEDLGTAAARALTLEPSALEESCGKISGEYLFCYPPGVPLLIPGELITSETLDYINSAAAVIKRGSDVYDGTLRVLP